MLKNLKMKNYLNYFQYFIMDLKSVAKSITKIDSEFIRLKKNNILTY